MEYLTKKNYRFWSDYTDFKSSIELKFSPTEDRKVFKTVRSELKQIEGAGNYHWAVICTEIKSSEYDVILDADTVNAFRYFEVGFKIVLEETSRVTTEAFSFDLYTDVDEILRDNAAGRYKFKIPKNQKTVTLHSVCHMYMFDDLEADKGKVDGLEHEYLKGEETQDEYQNDTSATLSDLEVTHDHLKMAELLTDIESSIGEVSGYKKSENKEYAINDQVVLSLSPLDEITKNNVRHYTQYLLMYAVDEIEKGQDKKSILCTSNDYIALANRIRIVLMQTRDAVKAHYFANLLVFALQNNFDALLSDCCETFAFHLSLMNYDAFWKIAKIMEPKSEELKARIIAFLLDRSFTPFELYEYFKKIFEGAI